ncbi:RNA-directed DNA polymerase from mobile element jockey [Amphibalanus amphitrite]|uniref:RNA-directed DNA polymerase from mobile element jockey n=1 Tax=Amphibalanus amphitrite TaxID=1232801 RepID=A0A6A4VFB1_AMPAM|nr:RNA-directed DNA polymerase from mobile element jockey [Amphibalanus amphitrite]
MNKAQELLDVDQPDQEALRVIQKELETRLSNLDGLQSDLELMIESESEMLDDIEKAGVFLTMQAIEVPVICAPLSRPSLPASVMAELSHLPMAGRPPPDEPLHVHILVGMDYFWSMRVPGTTAYMYADDTAALCAANDIRTAKERAQQAADTLSAWARAAKMQVAGEKTQALVLSQWSRDAVDCTLCVAGKTVTAGDHLKLLGVTLDRLLHFGLHCRNLRQRVRPRTAQLRKLTGRDWGLEERATTLYYRK